MNFKLLFIFTLIFFALPLSAMDHSSDLDKEFAQAIRLGNVEQAESCLIRGANIEMGIPYPFFSEVILITPLIFAAKNGYPKIVKLLLDYHANVNARTDLGKTVLMFAAANGHTEIVKLLLDHHADVNAKDNFKYTALIHAATNGYTKIVKLLLDYHADVNATDIGNSSALHHAALFNHSAITNILLKYGAKVNLENFCKNIALHQADTDTLEPLLKHILSILDQAYDPQIYYMWDKYIFDALNAKQTWCYLTKMINQFRLLLHHADKLPLSTKKLESLTAKELGKRETGEEAFRESVKHLRKHAF